MAEEFNRVLVLDAAARKRLRKFVTDAGPRIEARIELIRSHGAKAKAAGLGFEECPYFIGSYMSIRWLEGWSGHNTPEREYVTGSGFNMTPQQDIAAFTDWVMSLSLTDDIAGRLLKAHRSSYRDEALPKTQ